MADDPKPKLTPKEKENWNKFIDFVSMQKMGNNPILNQRNKQVGMGLIQKFNYSNPDVALSPDIVPRVQQEIQDYRNNLIQQWKAGKLQPSTPIKDESEIMPDVSPVDGWPGTKTLSYKFPTATVTVNGDTTKTMEPI